MNEKTEINGYVSSAERMLQGAIEKTKDAWQEGELMLNPRQYSELAAKVGRCKKLIRQLENQTKQFEPSATSRAVAMA